MAHVSNCLFGIVNLVSLLLSAPVVAVSVWMSWDASTTQCGRLVQAPAVALAGSVLVLSAVGLAGSCGRWAWLIWAYLVAMSLLIVGLFGVAVFAAAMIREVNGVDNIPGKAYKEFRLVGDDSGWLRGKVNDNWGTIKSCLIDGNFCRPMAKNASMSAGDFYRKTLTPLESGCCKPSNDCNFQYVSPTKWLPTNESATAKNSDCRTWSNMDGAWCLDCHACKAAMLFHLNLSWVKLAVVSFIMLVSVCVVYAIGCCALRNQRRDGWKDPFLDDIK